jgi:hypothetical protein
MERDPAAAVQRIRRRLQGNLFVDAGAVDDDDIDNAIDAAYEDNLAAGRIVSPEFVDDTAKDALASQLDSMPRHAESERLFDRLGIEMEEILRDEFASTRRMLEREHGSVSVPTPEDFRSGGVDLEVLMEEFAEMDAKDMGPMLVISQINMSGPRWKQIFTSLTKDASIADNPLKEHENYRTGHKHGLDVPSFPNDSTWQAIRHDAKREILFGPQHLLIMNVVQDPDNPSFDIPWTIRVLPTTDLGRHARPYPTIDEYLTMQARLVQEGEGPIMGRYRLAGVSREATDARYQPYGGWNPAEGIVEISKVRLVRSPGP